MNIVAWEKGFLPLVCRQMASYCPPVEAHYRRVLFSPVTMPGLTLPLYIRMTGLHAAIGLRLKLYSVRTLGGEERPACLWCHTPRVE